MDMLSGCSAGWQPSTVISVGALLGHMAHCSAVKHAAGGCAQCSVEMWKMPACTPGMLRCFTNIFHTNGNLHGTAPCCHSPAAIV